MIPRTRYLYLLTLRMGLHEQQHRWVAHHEAFVIAARSEEHARQLAHDRVQKLYGGPSGLLFPAGAWLSLSGSTAELLGTSKDGRARIVLEKTVEG